jgi:hypothetical protein
VAEASADLVVEVLAAAEQAEAGSIFILLNINLLQKFSFWENLIDLEQKQIIVIKNIIILQYPQK